MRLDDPHSVKMPGAYVRALSKLREAVDVAIWFVKNGFEDPRRAKQKLLKQGLPKDRADALFGED
jgi:hypothetical protein